MTLTTNEKAELMQLAQESVYAYRDLLGSQLGQQSYGADRDYYRILGYKRTITLNDYWTRYERGDLAARIVDLPAQDTWRRPPKITVNGSDEHGFVNAWDDLASRLKIWSVLSRLDKLAGLGRYGVLLLGVAGGTLESPMREQTGPEALHYLRPFAELHAEVMEIEMSQSSPRYGLPTMYELTLQSHDNTMDEKVPVHWTRIIHVADNKLDSAVYGVPRLKKVWNRLDDLMKLTGGAAEATWLSMRRGTVFQTQEGYKLSGASADVAERQEMIKQYVHDIARILVLEGMEVSDLGGSTVDPRGSYEVILAQISAATGIPQRVLVGSAQGELAAAEQDTKIWYDQIASRQTTFAEPDVLRPFIDRLIEFGMLPAVPEGYDIGEEDDDGERKWPSLWQVSDVEASAIAMNYGQAIAATRNPVTGRVPLTQPEMRRILGVPGDVPEGEQIELTPMPVRPAEGGGGQGRPRQPSKEGAKPKAGPSPSNNLDQALQNYADGKISAKQLAQYAAMSWARNGG